MLRFATITYGLEGKEVRERLWKETVEEFKFADVESIMSVMKASKDGKVV